MTMPSITADAGYWVDVTCPNCGQTEIIPLELTSRVERTRHETLIGIKAATKKIPHRCGQTSITVVGDTGEIVGQIGMDA